MQSNETGERQAIDHNRLQRLREAGHAVMIEGEDTLVAHVPHVVYEAEKAAIAAEALAAEALAAGVPAPTITAAQRARQVQVQQATVKRRKARQAGDRTRRAQRRGK